MTDPGNRIALRCATCGSAEVTRDALARWSVERQAWILRGLLDEVTCEVCKADTRLVEAVLIT